MKIINKYKKEIKFLITGGSSTLLDYVIYMLLSNSINISVSKVISMSIASIYSYFINKKWTFTNKEKVSLWQVSKFVICQVINIAVNTTTNYLIYNLCGNRTIAFIIATGVAMVVNFLIQNYFVFKNKE